MSLLRAPLPLASLIPSDRVRSACKGFGAAVRNAVLLSLVINVLMLASPLFMLQVYDRVLVSRSMPTLLTLLGLVAGVFLVAAILETIRQRLMARIAAGIAENLASDIHSVVLNNALLRRASADATQPARDLDALRQYLAGPGPGAFFDAPWVPVYLGFAYLLHPTIGLMTAVAAGVLFCVALSNERATKRLALEGSQHQHRSLALIEGARQGAEVLRAMGMEQRFRDRWLRENSKAHEHKIKATDRMSVFSAGTRMLRLFLQSAVLALGAALAIEGQVSAGTIVAASIIMSRALAPVEQVTGQWGSYQAARRALDRLMAALRTAACRRETMALPAAKGKVSVENVAIAAPGTTQPILSNVNFSLTPGDGLGIIGPSGSGKSTLVRVLAGVWAPVTGTLRLDDACLDQWSSEQFGNAVGYVPQDVELFAGTVTDNIARFAPEADPAGVVRAAQRANIHEMILHLPNGYATELGEGGVMLSAGQRQRIAMARALYNDPVLLLLDEPNSNLDGPGEIALVETLASLRKAGVTVIIVSHRPSTLQITNKILCLQDGRQAAFGPRDEILNMPRRPTNLSVVANAEERAS